MLFNRKKYTRLAFALILLILGFVLMSGPGNDDPQKFDITVFSFRRITLAPFLVIGTYAGLIFLILKKTKKCSGEKQR